MSTRKLSATGIVAAFTALGLPLLAAAADADLVSEGQKIFRFDTFGDEQLWTDKLGLHKVVEQKVDPVTRMTNGSHILARGDTHLPFAAPALAPPAPPSFPPRSAAGKASSPPP